MKRIFIYFTTLFMLNSFAANAQTPSVSLNLSCPSTTVSPGISFIVDAAYGYSNVNGNLAVNVNYNNQLVSFCGSVGFSIAPVRTTIGNVTTLTYLFPASAGENQTGAIQLCFTFNCPQTCFGTNLSANFTGDISSATLLHIPANPCTANGIVTNTWTGQNSFVGYACQTNIVTFRLQFDGTCYKINNPNILISPSLGTLLNTSLGTVSGSTIILPASLNPAPYGGYILTYSIQLPCGTTGPLVFTCGAVLNGDNCGSPVTNLITFNNATYNVPANSTTSGELVQATYATYNGVRIYNTGNTPLSTTLTTLMPQVKINRILLVTDQSIGLQGNLTLFACDNTPTTISYNSGIPIPVTSLISKSSITIENLLPGESCGIEFDYDLTASCTGQIPNCHSFITSGTFASYVVPNACNCSQTLTQTLNTQNTEYCAMPEVGCNYISDDAGTCKKAGDVVHICVGFENFGTAPVINGQITFPIPSYLDYSGNLSFNSSPLGISAVVTGGNLVITLPPSISFYSTQRICFDATVNATAPNGLFSYYFRIRGDNLRDQTLYCLYNIRICEDPKVEIEKLVKGSLDQTFTTNGTGVAGSIATYQITVKNKGNTPVNNIEILDRTAESGDKTIRTCTARGSEFSLTPNGVFNPSPLGSFATYVHSTGGVNQVPPAWAGLPGCDNRVSTFTSAVNNTVKINLPAPIPPFTNYSFEMQVLVPSTATSGQKAFNTVAIKSDYLDVASNSHPLEIIESGLTSLTIPVVPAPVIISCPNNQTENSCQSQSAIDAAFAVWKAAFSYTGGCGTTATNLNSFAAPGKCGGTVTITYTVTSTCGQSQSCTKTFTVVADNIRPVITATGNSNALECNPTAAQIEAALGSATATDNCSVGTPIATDGPVTGTCSKSQTRTWNVSDACGNTAIPISRTATWTVDITPPVFTSCPQDISVTACTNNIPITYTVTATDNCSSPILSYTFTGATTASGTGTGSGSLFLVGITHVTVTAKDACGNLKTCSFNVTVMLNSEINISICTVPTTTIYRGTTSGVGPLGPQSLTLTSTITGGTPGYSYSWTPSTGLDNPNIANPVASPTATTTYVLTVTDSKGCTRSLSIPINVRPLSDAVCFGNGNNVKFNVCHIPPGNPSNPQNICISENALPAHLVSGTNGHNNCYLGPCGQQLCFSTTPGGTQAPALSRTINQVTPVIQAAVVKKIQVTPVIDASVVEKIPTELKDEFSVHVSPNPSSSTFSIQVFSKSHDPIILRILDNIGVVRSVSSMTSKANSIKIGGNLTGGIYIAEVTQGTNRKLVKLVKIN